MRAGRAPARRARPRRRPAIECRAGLPARRAAAQLQRAGAEARGAAASPRGERRASGRWPLRCVERASEIGCGIAAPARRLAKREADQARCVERQRPAVVGAMSCGAQQPSASSACCLSSSARAVVRSALPSPRSSMRLRSKYTRRQSRLIGDLDRPRPHQAPGRASSCLTLTLRGRLRVELALALSWCRPRRQGESSRPRHHSAKGSNLGQRGAALQLPGGVGRTARRARPARLARAPPALASALRSSSWSALFSRCHCASSFARRAVGTAVAHHARQFGARRDALVPPPVGGLPVQREQAVQSYWPGARVEAGRAGSAASVASRLQPRGPAPCPVMRPAGLLAVPSSAASAQLGVDGSIGPVHAMRARQRSSLPSFHRPGVALSSAVLTRRAGRQRGSWRWPPPLIAGGGRVLVEGGEIQAFRLRLQIAQRPALEGAQGRSEIECLAPAAAARRALLARRSVACLSAAALSAPVSAARAPTTARVGERAVWRQRQRSPRPATA